VLFLWLTPLVLKHGFCDASDLAYGACIYVKCISSHNVVHVTLLSSKSQVARIKKQMVPRHDLCDALLLARLLHKVIDALNFEPSNNIFLWTDCCCP
jgi:hypothetical protein